MNNNTQSDWNAKEELVKARDNSLRSEFSGSQSARKELADFVREPRDERRKHRQEHQSAHATQNLNVEQSRPAHAPELRLPEVALREHYGDREKRHGDVADAERHGGAEAAEVERAVHEQCAEQPDAEARGDVHEQRRDGHVLRLAEATQHLIHEAPEAARNQHEQVLAREKSHLRTRRKPVEDVLGHE